MDSGGRPPAGSIEQLRPSSFAGCRPTRCSIRPKFARLYAAAAGVEGVFVGGHMLNAKTAEQILKKMIGRALTLREANALLNRL